MTEFTSMNYENVDFKEEQKLYTKFYYDEISTAPCVPGARSTFSAICPNSLNIFGNDIGIFSFRHIKGASI